MFNHVLFTGKEKKRIRREDKFSQDTLDEAWKLLSSQEMSSVEFINTIIMKNYFDKNHCSAYFSSDYSYADEEDEEELRNETAIRLKWGQAHQENPPHYTG